MRLKIRTPHPLLIPTAVALSLSFSTAAFASQTDTLSEQQVPAHWKCKWCEFDAAIGQFWTIEFGLQTVSQDNEDFGRYNAMEEKSTFGVLGFNGESLNEEGTYFKAQGSELLLDHRQLSLVNGKQGVYEVGFGYQETKQFNGRVGTPFQVNGANQLVLPSDWVYAQISTDFTALGSSLHNVELDASTKRIELSGKLNATNPGTSEQVPQFAIDYKKDTKSGVRAIGGAIGIDNAFDVNSSLLPLPFDHQTEQVDASVSYVWQDWHLKAGYYSSIFKDKGSATTWQNPFSDGSDGWGRRAAAPDNQFQQLYFSSSYRFIPTDYQRTSVATGYLAFGQMKQDEQYLPLSINPMFANAPLAQNSLDGKVNTITGNLKIVSPLDANWRVKASYRYNEKDNQTNSNAYHWISADSVVSPALRTNVPYSYTKAQTKMSASYNNLNGSKTSFGAEYERYDRTYQERKNTREMAVWFDYSTIWSDVLSSRLKLELSDRDGDGYREIDIISPPQNPLMRKFYLADRNRRNWLLDVFYLPSETLNVNVLLEMGTDDYQGSSIGLQQTNYTNANIDLSWMFSEDLTLYGYLNREFYRSRQAGSQVYAIADWFNDSEDNTYTAGFGFAYMVTEDELEVGVDLVYSKSKERNRLTSDTLTLSLQSLPQVEVELASLEFFADYQISETLSLTTRLIVHTYDDDLIEDYALSADSVEDLLLFDRNYQDEDVSYLAVSLNYKF